MNTAAEANDRILNAILRCIDRVMLDKFGVKFQSSFPKAARETSLAIIKSAIEKAIKEHDKEQHYYAALGEAESRAAHASEHECLNCGKPVGNPVFTYCDNCWSKPDSDPVSEQCPECGTTGGRHKGLCGGGKPATASERIICPACGQDMNESPRNSKYGDCQQCGQGLRKPQDDTKRLAEFVIRCGDHMIGGSNIADTPLPTEQEWREILAIADAAMRKDK